MRGAPLLVLCLLLAGCATAPADDDAAIPPGPTTLPPPTPTPRAQPDGEQLWTQFAPGFASPAADEPFRHPVLAEDAQGRLVFLGALENRTGRVVVHALDALHGDVHWTYAGGPERERVSALAHHARDRLLLVAADATVLALDARTGEPRWNQTLAPAGRVSSLGVAPDGTILAAGLDPQRRAPHPLRGGQGYLVALDPATGAQRWRVTPEAAAPHAPALSVAADGSAAHLVLGEEVHPPGVLLQVSAHDLGDGTARWTVRHGMSSGTAVNLLHDPVNATLYVTGQGSTLGPTTAVLALDDADGAVRWTTGLPMRGLGALARSPDGTLVCAAGPLGTGARVDCLRAEDGAPAWNATRAPMHGDRLLQVNGLAFSRDGDRLLLLVAGGSALHADGTSRGGGGEVMLSAYDDEGRPRWDRGWHRDDDLGTAAALLASRHAPRAYLAGDGGSVHRDQLTVEAVHLGG